MSGNKRPHNDDSEEKKRLKHSHNLYFKFDIKILHKGNQFKKCLEKINEIKKIHKDNNFFTDYTLMKEIDFIEKRCNFLKYIDNECLSCLDRLQKNNYYTECLNCSKTIEHYIKYYKEYNFDVDSIKIRYGILFIFKNNNRPFNIYRKI